VWADGGFLHEMGYHDLAGINLNFVIRIGVSVVHVIGGIWGLFGAYFLGPRKDRFE
jgi:ammonia channel protein AmtB